MKQTKTAAKPMNKVVTRTRTSSIESHLASIKALADTGIAAGEALGACLVSDPQTGTSQCIRTDQNTCKALHGVFIGGPCGG